MSDKICRFICPISESCQEWFVSDDGTPMSPIHPIADDKQFVFYQKENGRYFGVEPEFREIILGILGEFVDITTYDEPKKKL